LPKKIQQCYLATVWQNNYGHRHIVLAIKKYIQWFWHHSISYLFHVRLCIVSPGYVVSIGTFPMFSVLVLQLYSVNSYAEF